MQQQHAALPRCGVARVQPYIRTCMMMSAGRRSYRRSCDQSPPTLHERLSEVINGERGSQSRPHSNGRTVPASASPPPPRGAVPRLTRKAYLRPPGAAHTSTPGWWDRPKTTAALVPRASSARRRRTVQTEELPPKRDSNVIVICSRYRFQYSLMQVLAGLRRKRQGPGAEGILSSSSS